MWALGAGGLAGGGGGWVGGRADEGGIERIKGSLGNYSRLDGEIARLHAQAHRVEQVVTRDCLWCGKAV